MRRVGTLLTVMVVVAAAGSLASAQDGDAEASARRAFRMGQAHYENGEFAQAAASFEEAYRLSRRVRLLYNAHVAYRDMQDIENAARTLRLFLEESTDADLPSTERDQLTARLAALEGAVARAGGGGAQPAPEPEPQPEPQPQTDPRATTDPGGPAGASAGGGGFNPSPVGFIVGGAGLALVITGIIVGALSSGDLSTLEAGCSGVMCPDTQELRDAQANGQTLALVGDILWITGAVATAAGVVLIFVLSDGGDDQPVAGFSCAPEGCYGHVGGRF